MRFVSKSINLLVVLRAGLPAQPLTGTPALATVSVRFKDGVADVPEGELTTEVKRAFIKNPLPGLQLLKIRLMDQLNKYIKEHPRKSEGFFSMGGKKRNDKI